jgi:hypothetical protein
VSVWVVIESGDDRVVVYTSGFPVYCAVMVEIGWTFETPQIIFQHGTIYLYCKNTTELIIST